MSKSVDDQIADLEKQIEELKAKKHALEHPIIEYPKYLSDLPVPKVIPSPYAPGVTVNSAEEEKAVRAAAEKAAKGETDKPDDSSTRANREAERHGRR